MNIERGNIEETPPANAERQSQHSQQRLSPTCTGAATAVAPGRDQASLIREVQELRALIATLEQRLSERNSLVERRAAQLRSLASELTTTEYRARRRLAQLLHDHLQQLLYAARLSISTVRRRLGGEEAQATFQHVDDLLNQCITESRSLTAEISPPILYDGGLSAGLQWLARQMQQTYGLSVEVDVDPAAEPETEDVRILLFESVRELLFNVVKHGGTQSVRVRMYETSDQQVRIDVADEGVGFDAAKLQWDGTSPSGLPSGFGLFSIRERLELLGGSMELDTRPGKGTRVSLCVANRSVAGSSEAAAPAQAAVVGPEGAAGESAAPRHNGKIRVLLADDHMVFRMGLLNLLQQEADLEVVAEASDGEKAVAAALQTRPDVVLMDVTMPRLDGIEATRRIAAALPGVCIVGLSAHQEEDMADAMREAGASLYLSKDSLAETLIAAIRGMSSHVCHK